VITERSLGDLPLERFVLRISLAIGLLAAALASCAAPSGGASEPPATGTVAGSVAPSSNASPVGQVEPTGPAPSAIHSTPLPAEALLMNSAVRIAVSELNVREEPSLASKKVGIVTPDNVMSLTGAAPVQADGFTWYLGRVVSETGELPALPEALVQQLSGWIAVAKGESAYVTPLAPRCPSAVDLVNVSAMLPAERLACFGRNSLSLEGVFGCNGCGGVTVGTYTPAWLITPLAGGPLSIDPSVSLGDIWMRFPPEGPPAPEAASIVRVAGHFDDERARDCTIAEPLGPTPSLTPVAADAARLLCRQEFVLETYEILGTDPDFWP
jgi:hypothetical protein